MVKSKMWKSGSVVGMQVGMIWVTDRFSFIFNIQIVGALKGEKGNEHNNLILTLTPTIKISLKRAFDSITEKFLLAQDGFEAYDCYTGQVEKVSFLKNL